MSTNSKVRTVIADDDTLAVRSLLRLLAPYQEEIDVVGIAHDGRKGLEMIERLRPELAFIDVEMPIIDGFEMCRQLDHKPLIVLTAAGSEQRQRLADAGALALLFKPIGANDITLLMNQVRAALELPATLQFRPGQS